MRSPTPCGSNPCTPRRALCIVVSAGPTREKIDPIRFISNYSTGRMGYAIASEAASRGHKVILVSGPTCLEAPRGLRTISVESACEMREAVLKATERADALIMAAAVCDWRPAKTMARKMKRGRLSEGGRRRRKVSLELRENPDILFEAGMRKGNRVLVGFSLETEDMITRARRKLREKNLDFIVANRLSGSQTVFGERETDFLIVHKDGALSRYERCSKDRLARHVIDKVEALCYSNVGKNHEARGTTQNGKRAKGRHVDRADDRDSYHRGGGARLEPVRAKGEGARLQGRVRE